ncbi:60S RIBOSOMAL PROTEIN L36 [Salix koriyanagi]|uniref:60S RIBOSOMAL PROTEIN L36 n=1 Tax=Salix koriyanagi TaxID=2511006 RepID=A0A9Q0ZUG1_9ROSI|nr:60S RIBOSOMAL PROTEIN L36 [Salix koriyanagi]
MLVELALRHNRINEPVDLKKKKVSPKKDGNLTETSIGRVHYTQLQANKQQQNKFLVMEAQQQEDGWPLGLRPLNARVGLVRNRDVNGSVSFSTLLSASNSSSTDSSSDLDTESSRQDQLGEAPLKLSREQKNYKSKPWLFSICSRLSPDVVSTNNNAPSLGHFLRVERRAAANIHRRGMIYGPRDFSPNLPDSGVNSQFLGDQIAPQSSSSLGVDGGRRSNTELLQHG